MKWRLSFFYGLLVLSFGVLVFRLFVLTVVEGKQNRDLSEGQRIRIRKITAPRGMIFDRNGKPLVRNVPVYKKCPVNDETNDLKSTKCEELGRDEALRLEVQGKDANVVVDIGREYPYGESMAHLLGYLSEATEDEVKADQFKMGDLIGRTGIEQYYDSVLRGVDGGELVEVNSKGETLRKIGKKDPLPGKDIILSIDADLQAATYKALAGKKGGVVAQDAKNGQVLALVSSPSFNPNKLTPDVLTNPDLPLFDRVISGAYPPGSTFKIITSAAGLEEGRINSQTTIEDAGVVTVGSYRYTNWYFTQYGRTEGVINLVTAIKRSTDTFFYKLGEMIGAKDLVAWGKRFGLGKTTGIDLPGEIPGFLPDPTGEWFLGNTYHLAIGQGNIGLTPLQVNMIAGVVASGGKLCSPKIMISQTSCQDLKIKPGNLEIIKEGMREVCAAGGTAFPFFDFQPQVACKTGTAEFQDPEGKTHAWLSAFAPLDDPKIVITVLAEAGGEGSKVAAPIAKEILEEYFGNNNR